MPGNHTIGNISATLRWDTVPDALKYQVRYQVREQTIGMLLQPMTMKKVLNWLFYNTTYEYQLSTLCPSGWTDWSPVYTFTTEDQEDCTLPLIVGTSVSDTSFTVTWLSVPNVTDQLIYYRMKGSSTWEQYMKPSDTFTATGLLPGNEYQFRFRVLYGGSWTTWSPILTLVTEAGNNDPCQAPEPQLDEVGNTYANISWSAINGATRYQIRYSIAGSEDWLATTISNLTGTSLSWLLYNTNYEYQLRSECPSGWTDWSGSYTFTTLDDPACTLPAYTGQSVTETSFTVSWTGVPDVVEQQIQYKRSGDSDWTYVSLAQDTSFTAANLYPGNLYQFRLRVNCQQGWTGWTNLANLVTKWSR
ncbi:MAG: fibronectin type III domain-containing protein [Saprospiraceae bacterium]